VIKPAKDLTGPEKVVCAMVFSPLTKGFALMSS
jgi:hypothetical protein